MNLQPQTENKGKRRSSTTKEEPKKRRIKEGTAKERQVAPTSSTSSSSWEDADEDYVEEDRRVTTPVSKWETIGENEEIYLAGTRKELFRLIAGRESFKERAKETSTEKLKQLMNSLFIYCRENVEELQMAQPKGEEKDPKARSKIEVCTALISYQHRRITWMMDEIWDRSDRRKAESVNRRRIIEKIRKENEKLRKDLEERTKERDELVGKMNFRGADLERKDASTHTEMGVPEAEKSDACVSTETGVPEADMEEVEMEGESTPSQPSQDISKGLERTLEEVIERKMGEILARIGLPLGKARMDTARGKPVTWAEVAKRSGGGPVPQRDSAPSKDERGRKAARTSAAPVGDNGGGPPKSAEESKTGRGREKKKRKQKRWPLFPKTAAVVLTAPVGREKDCSALIKSAEKEISLEEMEIPPLEIKRSRAGGLILGVTGQDSREKADRLARSLEKLAGDTGVRVTRPTKTADIRVSGLGESTTSDEVVAAIAKMTGCRVSDIRRGQLQGSPNGVCSLWLQCPVEAAVKAAKEGRLRVGWAAATVELLRARPQRCYRCLEVGHIGARCTSEVDRAQRCYRCGVSGHKASNCGERLPRCPLCVDNGRPHDHVLGGPGCGAPPQRQTRADDESVVVTPTGVT